MFEILKQVFNKYFKNDRKTTTATTTQQHKPKQLPGKHPHGDSGLCGQDAHSSLAVGRAHTALGAGGLPRTEICCHLWASGRGWDFSGVFRWSQSTRLTSCDILNYLGTSEEPPSALWLQPVNTHNTQLSGPWPGKAHGKGSDLITSTEGSSLLPLPFFELSSFSSLSFCTSYRFPLQWYIQGPSL